jgi:AcrR family transcriptional regulator
MPRHPDPELEKRVLDAAQKLWHGGGDKTLSMRALAKAARTNTPAIYRRFKDRKDILRALLLRARSKPIGALIGRSHRSVRRLCPAKPLGVRALLLAGTRTAPAGRLEIAGNRPGIRLAARPTRRTIGRIA